MISRYSNKAAELIRSSSRIPSYARARLFQSGSHPDHVVYITEDSDWVIQRIGETIGQTAFAEKIPYSLSVSPLFHSKAVIHFGSIHTFVHRLNRTDRSINAPIATFYHGNFGFDAEMDAGIERVLKAQKEIRRIIVSNSMMKTRVEGWGIPKDKLVLIPIGVHLAEFQPHSAGVRAKIRERLGIPKDATCVGSFQKDGSGWGDTVIPKLIKGPDIFVDSVARLAKTRRVHCLLTGPSRGYVKKRLDEEGVPYTHTFFKNHFDLVDCYNALDIYLVTSREEGGPIALMESMATGTPLVTTRVGMAVDMIENGENGFMVDVGDVDAIVESARKLLDDPALREKCLRRGFETVKKYDWKLISKQYCETYRDLFRNS